MSQDFDFSFIGKHFCFARDELWFHQREALEPQVEFLDESAYKNKKQYCEVVEEA